MKYCFRCERPISQWVSGKNDKIFCTNFCKDKEPNNIQRMEELLEAMKDIIDNNSLRITAVSAANQTMHREFLDQLILIERKIEEKL